jgi:hypothetical protein
MHQVRIAASREALAVLAIAGMKKQMQPQIQSCEISFPRDEQVRAEISSFLQAVDSYPARVAAEPNLTFHQHLCSFLTTAGDDPATTAATGRK